MGEGATGKLLVMSQFILSMQLPFAIVPLLFFTSDKKIMGEWVNKPYITVLGWVITGVMMLAGAAAIISLVL